MKSWKIRITIAVLAVCLIGALAWNFSEKTADKIFQLPVNGSQITIEQFHPPTQDTAEIQRPAIIMLHGMDGAEIYGRYYREYARAVANAGFQVFYVHYFDDSPYDDLYSLSEEELGRTILSDRDGWIDVVAQLVGQLAQRNDVAAERVGLLGFSLGGFVSLAATEKLVREDQNPRVAVVVEFFSGLFEDGKGNPVVNVAGFPPTLILHGEEDERVPVRKAHELDEKLSDAGVPHEIQTYPGKGHGFLGEAANHYAIEFFKQNLIPARSASK